MNVALSISFITLLSYFINDSKILTLSATDGWQTELRLNFETARGSSMISNPRKRENQSKPYLAKFPKALPRQAFQTPKIPVATREM